jgi:hypothetical protein
MMDSTPPPNQDSDTESQTEVTSSSNDATSNTSSSDSFAQRQARRMASRPCCHLWTALVIALGLSAIGLIVGEFAVSANTGGWQSKYTYTHPCFWKPYVK